MEQFSEARKKELPRKKDSTMQVRKTIMIF